MMPASRSIIRALALAALVMLVPAVAHAQCSMCRTLLTTPEGQKIAAALRSGIAILLAAPFGVFAAVAIAAIRSQRRFKEDNARAATPIS
jgi:hypothetical protein